VGSAAILTSPKRQRGKAFPSLAFRAGENDGSLIEDKLLGVDQRPENVLISNLLLLGVLLDVVQGQSELGLARLVTDAPQEKFLNLLGVRPLVSDELF